MPFSVTATIVPFAASFSVALTLTMRLFGLVVSASTDTVVPSPFAKLTSSPALTMPLDSVP